MKRRDFLSTILTTPLLLTCGKNKTPASPATGELNEVQALVHGTLIDGTGSDPIRDSALLIEDGRISAAGPYSTEQIPAHADQIDLEGATILPGFINTHVHGGYDESILRGWAEGGVTTVRDVGANPANDLFAMRDRLREKTGCARLIAAGPMITVPNGYPMVPWGSPIGLPVTSAVDAREKVVELIDSGADIIKIAVERGVTFGESIPTLSLEEIRAIVDAAHERGTPVTAHVLSSIDLELALDGGVDDIAHMVSDGLHDRLIDRMVSAAVTWVPTLELWHGVGYGLDQIAGSNLGRFVQAGGTVALGTDYAGYNSEFDLGMPIREVGWMRDAGMTSKQIIVAATKNAAKICNRSEELGTLEKGRRADLLVVNGDPLEDLQALTNVRMVMRDGISIAGLGTRD